MSIKVYSHPLSPPGRKVLLCLAEKELDHEFVFIDVPNGQHKKDPLIAINPFGQVPAFEDGDLKLFGPSLNKLFRDRLSGDLLVLVVTESRAITRYIAEAYADKGTPLLSADPKKNSMISLWIEVESLKFDVVAQKINFQLVVRPMMGQQVDEVLVKNLIPQLASLLDVYETRLAKSKYLAGEAYTLADLHHAPIINSMFKTKVKTLFDERPHVSRWCADILARPAWKKVLDELKM